MKHTPGPWEISGWNQNLVLAPQSDTTVCTVQWNTEANAKLIAAAPDLLEALETLRSAFVVAVGDKSPFAKVALIKADQAISKAKQS